MQDRGEATRVAIVGGGLAGLAAAVGLVDSGRQLAIELFESRRSLGGRAGSFQDPETGETVDHCQHVGMGCCTNLADFCRRTGLDHLFHRWRVLHFFGPDGRRSDLSASAWLPAPLHLAPSLLRLNYLSLGERIGIGRALLRLARTRPSADDKEPTFGRWLREQKQPDNAIERFWKVVIVSALSEEIDAVALSAARKVFVDGLMVHRRGYEVEVPSCSLGELYQRIANRLRERGVRLHLGRGVSHVAVDDEGVRGVVTMGGDDLPFDAVVVAASWGRVAALFSDKVRARLPELEGLERFQSAPITAVHLWFDQPIAELSHAVFIGRLSQWLFAHGPRPLVVDGATDSEQAYYYQVVISASRQLAGRPRDDVLDEVLSDLAAVFPRACDAELLHWRTITQHDAVFSPLPGVERLRPAQQSSLANLYWAGDWTRTGWPATMEGAVRSGYLAAEALLRRLGRPATILARDLSRIWLARVLCR